MTIDGYHQRPLWPPTADLHLHHRCPDSWRTSWTELRLGCVLEKTGMCFGQVLKKFLGRSGVAWDLQNSILVLVANLPCRLEPHSEAFYSAPINFWIGNWPVCVSLGNTGHFHEQYYFLKRHWNNIATTPHRCFVCNGLPYTASRITAKTAPKTAPKATRCTAPRHPTPHPELQPKQHLEQHHYSNHNHIRTQKQHPLSNTNAYQLPLS